MRRRRTLFAGKKVACPSVKGCPAHARIRIDKGNRSRPIARSYPGRLRGFKGSAGSVEGSSSPRHIRLASRWWWWRGKRQFAVGG